MKKHFKTKFITILLSWILPAILIGLAFTGVPILKIPATLASIFATAITCAVTMADLENNNREKQELSKKGVDDILQALNSKEYQMQQTNDVQASNGMDREYPPKEIRQSILDKQEHGQLNSAKQEDDVLKL